MTNNNGIAVMATIIGLMLLHSGSVMTYAATYYVGDEGGWGPLADVWGDGKMFKEGDTLVFNYIYGEHNVVVVDKAGYDGCYAPPNATVYDSGHDLIKLVKGENYFISTQDKYDCVSGNQLAVVAN